jgi:hypothetical protein
MESYALFASLLLINRVWRTFLISVDYERSPRPDRGCVRSTSRSR